jgi:hypothetical protein
VILSIGVHPVFGCFTRPTSIANNYIQQNEQGTWCYYPGAGQTSSVSCPGEYPPVLAAHLAQTISIGYYAPDGARLGGAEWPVPQTDPGKIFLCASGQVGDGTYQTLCTSPVTADNSIPGGGCFVVVAQTSVSDGCYVPLQAIETPRSPTSSVATPTRTTRTSTITTTVHPPETPSPSDATTLPWTSTWTVTTTTSSLPPPIPQPAGSRSRNNLSTSDTIGIVFGLISALGVIWGGILKYRKYRRTAQKAKRQNI